MALLRGINLGSRNKVAMGDLRALFEALGASEVRTHLNTGNVVFRPDEAPGSMSAAAIEERIARDLGVPARVVLRSAAELDDLLASNPFLERGADLATLHVTFLGEAPDAERVARLDPRRGEPDELAVRGRDVYLHCPNGYGRTAFSNAFLERQLAVPATTRTWRTVTALRDLAAA